LPGYTLPDGLTLRNKLGAIGDERLEATETEYVKNRQMQIRRPQS